jgi:hypothetical protein
MAEDMTYEPVQTVAQLAARVQELEAALSAQCGLTAQLIEQRAGLERENGELRKAYEPVERSFRVVWTACAFGYEGTPVGEALNHIKAWFDGVRL